LEKAVAKLFSSKWYFHRLHVVWWLAPSPHQQQALELKMHDSQNELSFLYLFFSIDLLFDFLFVYLVNAYGISRRMPLNVSIRD